MRTDFHCDKCNLSLEELQSLGKVERVPGSHYICLDCDNDIRRNLTMEDARQLANFIWDN